jgi:hypothetical protein
VWHALPVNTPTQAALAAASSTAVFQAQTPPILLFLVPHARQRPTNHCLARLFVFQRCNAVQDLSNPLRQQLCQTASVPPALLE